MTTSEVTQEVNAGPLAAELALRRPPRRDFGEDSPEAVQARLKAERVQEKLATMPGWRLTDGGTAITRVHVFPQTRVATVYAAYVTEFAAVMQLLVSVLLSGNRAVVTLKGVRRGRGREVTDTMLDFATVLG
jgi:pterin-4a-carbinolamine dehydratase